MFHRPKTEDQATPGTQGSVTPASDKTENLAQARESVTAVPAQSTPPLQGSQPVASPAPASLSPQANTSGGFRPSVSQPAKPEQTIEKENRPMNTPSNNDKPETAETAFSHIPGTAGFQRPNATGPQAPRVPGTAYSPTYGAAASSPYGSSSSASERNNRKLVVGEGITMSGEIESCDVLIVEGTVEAALKGASILDIAESGMFYGTVEIDECTIAGRFEGDITVHGRMTLKATGSVTGSISYKELAVEAGATIDGKMSPLNASVKKTEKKDGKPGGLKVPGKMGQQGGELPFAGHVSAAE